MLLSEAIDRYKADRLAKGFVPSTVRSQQSALKTFLADVGNIHVGSLNPRHMDTFWSRHGDWSERTFNKVRGILSAFFKWCQTRGYLSRSADPMEGVRRRRETQKTRLIIPRDEFEPLLDSVKNPRDRAIVAIGLYLFTRISETTTIRWSDVNFKSHTVQVFRQKTGTIDILPMCEELEDELRRWRLTYAAEVGEVPHPGWYVVPSYSTPQFAGRDEHGHNLFRERPTLLPTHHFTNGTRSIKMVLKDYGYDELAGEGAHTLRRSGATALYEELSLRGHDRAIRLCQAMLGHANISTTEVYLRLDLDRKVRNDLLAGRRMFKSEKPGVVVGLERVNGQKDTGSV
jgi:integrase